MKQAIIGTVLALGLAGCGGGSSGDAAAGKTLFNLSTLGTTTRGAGCVTCHSVEAGKDGTGPSLFGYGTKAKANYAAKGKASAHAYIVDSIVNPNEEIAQGFMAGSMATNYGQVLTTEQQDNLAAYIETLTN